MTSNSTCTAVSHLAFSRFMRVDARCVVGRRTLGVLVYTSATVNSGVSMKTLNSQRRRRIAPRRCCSRTVAPCGAALAPWRWELWRQGRRLSMKNVPCPISLPDVLVPAPAERPTGLPAYSQLGRNGSRQSPTSQPKVGRGISGAPNFLSGAIVRDSCFLRTTLLRRASGLA